MWTWPVTVTAAASVTAGAFLCADRLNLWLFQRAIRQRLECRPDATMTCGCPRDGRPEYHHMLCDAVRCEQHHNDPHFCLSGYNRLLVAAALLRIPRRTPVGPFMPQRGDLTYND